MSPGKSASTGSSGGSAAFRRSTAFQRVLLLCCPVLWLRQWFRLGWRCWRDCRGGCLRLRWSLAAGEGILMNRKSDGICVVGSGSSALFLLYSFSPHPAGTRGAHRLFASIFLILQPTRSTLSLHRQGRAYWCCGMASLLNGSSRYVQALARDPALSWGLLTSLSKSRGAGIWPNT